MDADKPLCAWCLSPVYIAGELCEPCERQRMTDARCDYVREESE